MLKRLGPAFAAMTLAASLFVVATETSIASAADVDVPLSCLTSNVPVVGSQTSSRIQPVSTTASAMVAQNSNFTVSISTPPDNESSNAGSGATLNHVRDMRIRIPLPANA